MDMNVDVDVEVEVGAGAVLSRQTHKNVHATMAIVPIWNGLASGWPSSP